MSTEYSGPGRVFLVAGKRTPFGKFGESLKDVSPVELAVIAAKAVLQETGVDPKKIGTRKVEIRRKSTLLLGHVILGNVVPSTTDTMYGSRHLALKIGARTETPAYNVNRLCGSGIQAIVDAANYIKRGEVPVIMDPM